MYLAMSSTGKEVTIVPIKSMVLSVNTRVGTSDGGYQVKAAGEELDDNYSVVELSTGSVIMHNAVIEHIYTRKD